MQLASFWPRKAEVLPWAAGTVLLTASLANFLNRNDYMLLRADVAIVVFVLALASAVMALLYAGQRRLGRSILEGMLAYAFVDFNSKLLWLAIAVGCGVAGFTYWRRTSLLGPMALLGSVVLVTTFIGLGGRWTWIRSAPGTGVAAARPDAPPALLHIILDEHLGLEGLPLLGPEGVALRDDLKRTYLNAGFTVFGRAYSEHMYTVNAIPQVLNYGQNRSVPHSKAGVEIGPTEHLESLAKSGHAVKIFQSDFANICSGARSAQCTTYDSFSLRPLLKAPLSTVDRAKVILLKFVKLSDLSEPATLIWNVGAALARKSGIPAPGIELTSAALTSSVASFAALDELNKQLATAQPGDAFVVHLLLPHYPYVLSRDCALLPRTDWNWRKSGTALQKRQKAYMEQVRCVTSQVMKSVAVFRASPAGAAGAVIVHGDHGSRLTKVDPKSTTAGSFTQADMIAAFSTMFAVQVPHGQGEYVEKAQPVAVLVHAVASSGFRTAPRATQSASGMVYLADNSWQPKVRTALPPAWLDPSASIRY